MAKPPLSPQENELIASLIGDEGDPTRLVWLRRTVGQNGAPAAVWRTRAWLRLSGLQNRPTVRVQDSFSERNASALKRASLTAPSSFSARWHDHRKLNEGYVRAPCRSCACALLTMCIAKVHAAAQPRARRGGAPCSRICTQSCCRRIGCVLQVQDTLSSA